MPSKLCQSYLRVISDKLNLSTDCQLLPPALFSDVNGTVFLLQLLQESLDQKKKCEELLKQEVELRGQVNYKWLFILFYQLYAVFILEYSLVEYSS